jgi:hypothetical protein
MVFSSAGNLKKQPFKYEGLFSLPVLLNAGEF